MLINMYKIYIVIFIKIISDKKKYKNSNANVEAPYIWNSSLCLQRLKCLLSTLFCLWQNFTRLVSLISKIPQNRSKARTTTNSPWHNFALEIPTFWTLLRTYLWQRQHDVELEPSISALGICPHSGLGYFLCIVEAITARALSLSPANSP